MWSLGVITYIILTGNPPFYSNKTTAIYHAIIENDIDFPYDEWKDLSDESLDFTNRMLEYDPQKRLTPLDALNHEWMNENCPKFDNEIDVDILSRLMHYRSPCLLK
jgi:serine/threonine protein kinase